MTSLTDKFKSTYMGGFDCRLSTYRNNLAFYGTPISNGMTLGLSGSLTFIYSDPKNNRIPFYTVLGITDQSLEGLSTIFDSYLERGLFDINDNQKFEFIKERLANNILVNVAINRPYLNHIQSGKNKLDFKIDPYNVGFHYVTITEIDTNKNITFFETDFGQPITLDSQTFCELWFFDKMFTRSVYDRNQLCNGIYYTITPPNIDAWTNGKCIRFVTEKITKNFHSSSQLMKQGLNAVNLFFADLNQWKNSGFNSYTLITSLIFMKIFEKKLSGGGFGRRLYSYFLSEVSGLINQRELKPIALLYKETSKLWSNFVTELNHNSVISEIENNEFRLFETTIQKYASSIIEAESKQIEYLNNWNQHN